MKLTRDTATHTPGTRFIDPQVLTRLSSLELIAKTVVSGFISGLHRAPYLGLSTDFAEHRVYIPGDDVRRIDWRVYGRTDRLFLREFQAETNTNLTIALDISTSMAFQSGAISKLDYGRFLAASLGYLSLQQRDRVGLVTFDEDLVSMVPPSIKHFDRVLHELDTATPARAGGFEKPLATMFVWARIPEPFRQLGSLEFSKELLREAKVAVSPGIGFGDYGNEYVRFGLIENEHRTRQANRNIRALLRNPGRNVRLARSLHGHSRPSGLWCFRHE